VFQLGLDLGKHSDPTAMCILETVVNKPKKDEQEGLDPTRAPIGQVAGHHYHAGKGAVVRATPRTLTEYKRSTVEHRLRWLKRYDLGTQYRDIVKDVCATMRLPNLRNEHQELVVDATGVGVAVLEMFDDEWIFRRGKAERRRVPLVPITITPNGAATPFGNGWHVSKRDLVFALQVVMQNRELSIAGGIPETEAFVRELFNFKVKIEETKANDTWEAREGKHDDLVLSVAMAVWRARKGLGLDRPALPKGKGRRFAAIPEKQLDDTAERWLRGDVGASRGRRR